MAAAAAAGRDGRLDTDGERRIDPEPDPEHEHEHEHEHERKRKRVDWADF